MPATATLPKSPTAAPTPTLSTPAPVSAPTPTPAASPRPATPTPGVSTPVTAAKRPTVDPKRALGLPESTRKSVSELVSASRTKNKLDAPIPGLNPAPAPAPVVNPAANPPTPPELLEVPVAAPTPAPAPETAPTQVDPRDELIAKLQRDLEASKNPALAPEVPVPAEIPETPEQRAERSNTWVEELANTVPVEMTTEEMDTLLGGGEEAVKLHTSLRKKDIARGVLEARTSIYRDIQPAFDEIRQGLGVLLKNHIDVQRYTIENQFFSKYQDLTPHREYTNQVADYLLQTYPQECAKLSPDAFIDYLHGETTRLLDLQAKRLGLTSWKIAQAAPGAAPLPTLTAPVVPAAAAVIPPGMPTHISAPGPTGPISVPRPTAPTNPPSALAPGAAPAGGQASRSWGASVAADLRN